MKVAHHYVESFDTVSLAPYRIRRSPFAHRYTTPETVHAVYCNRLCPMKSSVDENPIPAYWKLCQGVLLYDVPEMPLAIERLPADRNASVPQREIHDVGGRARSSHSPVL